MVREQIKKKKFKKKKKENRVMVAVYNFRLQPVKKWTFMIQSSKMKGHG